MRDIRRPSHRGFGRYAASALGAGKHTIKTKKVRIKKRCCDSKRMCAGCPLRPENGGPGKKKRRKP